MMMTMKTVGVLGILASLITKRQLDSLVIKCQHQPQIQFVNQVEMVRMMIMKMTMRLKQDQVKWWVPSPITMSAELSLCPVRVNAGQDLDSRSFSGFH